MLSDWLWNRETGDVCGETVLFTESESAVLAFPAEEVTAVYNPTLGAVYAEGRDFRLEQGGRVLRRLPGSTMPFLTREWLYPSPERAVLFPDEGANAIGSASGSPTGLVCFDRADFFARHQVSIDYRTRAPFPAIPAVDPAKLPKTRKCLCEKKLLDIAFIGDSITDGWNSTEKVGVAPGQAPWPGLVTERLSRRTSCRMVNGAVSGSGSASGVEHLEACCREFLPALLFIAYGMNDLSHLSEEGFGRNISRIVDAGLAKNPDMEFVLVSQMSGNPEWDLTPAGKDTVFARKLRQIAEDGGARLAYAPVNELWHALIAGKRFLDVTGNGVNHPNDYGHRIYAAAAASVWD